MEQITRERHLTQEEADYYDKIREKIKQDLPDLINQHKERMKMNYIKGMTDIHQAICKFNKEKEEVEKRAEQYKEEIISRIVRYFSLHKRKFLLEYPYSGGYYPIPDPKYHTIDWQINEHYLNVNWYYNSGDMDEQENEIPIEYIIDDGTLLNNLENSINELEKVKTIQVIESKKEIKKKEIERLQKELEQLEKE